MTDPPDQRPTLYTIGYGGLTVWELADMVPPDSLITDIRLNTYSRNEMWSRNTRRNVEDCGHRYLWRGALGNSNYKGEAGSGIVIKDIEAVEEVYSDMQERGPVVLMCACVQPETCHRKVVADVAKRRHPDIRVKHIRSRPAARATIHEARPAPMWDEGGSE